jgi:hypothetical protein
LKEDGSLGGESDMRVMLDNGIFGHSQFADSAMGPQGQRFGPGNQHHQVWGVVRKKLDPNEEYQSQMDSLFTVGRLIREKQVEAFTYRELMYESFNRIIGMSEFDALAGCAMVDCPPALMRSRFRSGDLFEFVMKGGKKDRKRGLDTRLSQIDFMEWLCTLDERHVSAIVECRTILGLTEFEMDSLRNLRCFQKLCTISQSPENYPDMFHLWTAQRNRMDVFLTLESTLPQIFNHIEHARVVEIEHQTKVLRPLEFLRLLGVTQPDPVPIEPGRFYPMVEVWNSR